MIAVDTSALMAILLDEPPADACMAALAAEDAVLISGGTMAEAMIVAARRQVGAQFVKLIDGLGLEVVAVTAAVARRVAAAYSVWGKGIHAAGLNFGDCFAYEVAQHHACALLYVGEDFSKTDVRSVIESA